MRLQKLLVGLIALSWFGAALGADAYLRLRCEGDTEGSDVFINGTLKGQCPIDLALAEGQIDLKVVKRLDDLRYQLFTSQLFLSAGAMKRLDVVIEGEILFTPEGRKQEDQRLAALKAAADAQAAQMAAADERARIQAEKDAPLIAAQKQAAEAQAAQQAVIAQAAARRAEPSGVQRYLDSMSTKGPDDSVSSATLATSYAPILLPSLTMDDMSTDRSIAMTDPTAFGNPDSMIAKVMHQQKLRTTQPSPLALAQR